MLESELKKKRREIATKLMRVREIYALSVIDISKYSTLSTETIYRLEGGIHPWNIDSEIKYIHGIETAIKKRKELDPALWERLKMPDLRTILSTLQHY